MCTIDVSRFGDSSHWLLWFTDDAEADVADPMHMYYVNDGVYGSFNCILYDHVTVEASLLDVCTVYVVCCFKSLHSNVCLNSSALISFVDKPGQAY